MIIVSDASPLIALGRIGKLDLLREIFGSLILPDAVWKEVVDSGTFEKPFACPCIDRLCGEAILNRKGILHHPQKHGIAGKLGINCTVHTKEVTSPSAESKGTQPSLIRAP